MRFEIDHTTRFVYSRAVYLEPMVVRLHPRADAAHLVNDFKLTVTPPPTTRSDTVDADSNAVSLLWFTDKTEELVLHATSVVQTLNPNPFDYVMAHETSERFPVQYSSHDLLVLQPHLLSTTAPLAAELASELMKECDFRVVDFLNRLCEWLYVEVEQYIRPHGEPHPSEFTLTERTGTCRDLTVAFMDACRAVGLASRFVSGYQEGDPDQTERDLHAWPEVFVPEAGWRGYDPTHGLAVADRHIALAASAHPAGAAPTTGTFRGTDATSQLTAEIRITAD